MAKKVADAEEELTDDDDSEEEKETTDGDNTEVTTTEEGDDDDDTDLIENDKDAEAEVVDVVNKTETETEATPDNSIAGDFAAKNEAPNGNGAEKIVDDIETVKQMDEDIEDSKGKEEIETNEKLNVVADLLPNKSNLTDTPKTDEKLLPQRIALLGERNTGTRWMTSQLEKCFPTIKVSSRLLRWKHWFQEDDHKSHKPTLVIAQFRNVFEWTEAMRKVPHHAPYHLSLEWKEFVTKPWTMPRPKRDEIYKESNEQKCYEKFRYNELISCVEGSRDDKDYKKWAKTTGFRTDNDFSGHKPIYELKQDGSGDPFGSILEMRAAKIKNFLSLKDWDWVQDSIPVRYEKLLSEGTDFLISEIEEKLQITRSCEAVPPQTSRKKRSLDPDYVEWMKENVDWETETLIGYTKDENLLIDKKTPEETEGDPVLIPKIESVKEEERVLQKPKDGDNRSAKKKNDKKKKLLRGNDKNVKTTKVKKE